MSNSPLVIAHLDPPDLSAGGDFFYRSYLPSKALSETSGVAVMLLGNLSPYRDRVLMAADIVVMHNVCDMDLLPVMESRRRFGGISVFEISDDITDIQPWSAVRSFYANEENLRLFRRLAHSSDAIQCTVPQLKRVFGHLHSDCAVFLNQLGDVSSKPSVRDSFVIGWGGSHGHLKDIEGIAQPLSNWICAHEDTRLAIMGSLAIYELFSAVPSSQKLHRRPGTLEDYYSFLDTVDVGLAPLCDNPFNRSRSDVKFLEYAAHGVVTVAQALEPYLESVKEGETGFLFGSSEQLLAILDSLYAQRSLREKIVFSAHDYVVKNRLQKDHVEERLDYYRAILGRSKIPRRQEPNWREFVSLDSVVKDGNLLHFQPGAFERLLHDGLVLSQQERLPVEALRRFRQATVLHPESYLPELFCARVSSEPISPLTSALQKNPHSIRAHLDLSSQLFKRGEIAKAVNLLLSAAQLFPSYELPYQKTIPILESLGAKDEAIDMQHRVSELLKQIGC